MTEKSNEVMQNMMRIINAIRKNGARHYHYQYSSQTRVLALIAQHQDITQSELSELLDIRPSSTSELLKKLESKGLVTRSADPNDGRVSHFTLTDAGQKIAKEFHGDAINDLTENLTQNLTSDEVDQLNHLLEKVLDGFETDDEDFNGWSSDDFRRTFNRHRGGHGFGFPHGDRPRGFFNPFQ
ncbi:MarR family winged helix-turn-helix transcriptional regulator [Levilactobacillus bambusae]|uniref:MarR family transcriptional regulator n=1 Tax=Levilactobacillus bambusae TaxID=2024736 RepID=A0A2V1N272_9LACO|nr:MarR family transcriptional regulator [Levilactobacillus bambusae]PWG00396.1 MarR family transcriptional regulator [Levilactobacillus bambusae]